MYLYSFNEKGTAVGLLCCNDNGIRFNRRDSFLFFFLVLCLPRQVRTCCNPLSSSSPVTSFLVFLFIFFPSVPCCIGNGIRFNRRDSWNPFMCLREPNT